MIRLKRAVEKADEKEMYPVQELSRPWLASRRRDETSGASDFPAQFLRAVSLGTSSADIFVALLVQQLSKETADSYGHCGTRTLSLAIPLRCSSSLRLHTGRALGKLGPFRQKRHVSEESGLGLRS